MCDKRYEDLTFTDDFMFCKVLTNNLNLCKELLEMILNVKIRKIENVIEQKAINITADAKSVRLDVYVEDDGETIYNIEMQTTTPKNLPKRMRYYEGMIDMNQLEKGNDYKLLKKTYIIFICLNNPWDRGRHFYTFNNRCEEDQTLLLGDEATKVVISTEGNLDDVSSEIADFLEYLRTGTVKEGSLASRIDEAVQKARKHEEWKVEYMTLLMRDNEKREEGYILATKLMIFLMENNLHDIIEIIRSDYSKVPFYCEKYGIK